MIGEGRQLPRLYRELAQEEKNLNKIDAQEAHDAEELGMIFNQMMDSKFEIAKKMTMASTLQSFEHDTIKFVVSNIN